MKILLVDDDRDLVDLLRYAFKRDRHTPVTAFDGEAALRVYETEGADVVVLDMNMPKRDGLSVLQELRRQSQVPVIMLTAMGDEDHLVKAFEMGADDYLVKPFRPRELNMRVEALIRRSTLPSSSQPASSRTLICGEVTLDPQQRVVTVSKRAVRLTKNEFALLHYLMLNSEITVSTSDILANVWGYDTEESEDLVKVAISRLRHKVEADPSQPHYIKTMYGVGYMLHDDNR
jgi:two-component system, OmpR family, response regulator RpaB